MWILNLLRHVFGKKRRQWIFGPTSSKTFNTWILKSVNAGCCVSKKTLVIGRVYNKLFLLGSETETRSQCAKPLTFHCSSEAIHFFPGTFHLKSCFLHIVIASSNGHTIHCNSVHGWNIALMPLRATQLLPMYP